jgi:hypothetical protein
LSLDITSRVQRLQSFDNIEVLGVDFLVFGLVEVLLGDNNSLLEEVLVDFSSVFLRNEHVVY